MRLYLGSRDYRPDGFLTVDLDPGRGPDIVADVTDLAVIGDAAADEICASHILEHLPWPLAFKALAEWARVLKPGGVLRVAVPDLAALGSLAASGRNPWAAAGLIYGLGRLTNALEAHQYGYTRQMLLDVLAMLGFGRFDWWKHDLPDASNGWLFDEDGERIALSLNIAATKLRPPSVDPAVLLADLTAAPMAPFDVVLARRIGRDAAPPRRDDDPQLTQRLHFALIEARMRIRHLEGELHAAQQPARPGVARRLARRLGLWRGAGAHS